MNNKMVVMSSCLLFTEHILIRTVAIGGGAILRVQNLLTSEKIISGDLSTGNLLNRGIFEKFYVNNSKSYGTHHDLA